MKKLLALIVFSVLLLVPVGIHNAFALTFDVDNGGPIPPSGTSGTTIFRFTVAGEAPVVDLDVRLFLEHTWDGDLIISLTSPAGTTVVLSDRRGGSGDDYLSTVFDDGSPISIAAGSPPFTGFFRPEFNPPGNSLFNFNGENPNGIWTLTVEDIFDPDFGFLYKTGDTFSTGSTVSRGTQLIFNDPIPPTALCKDATVPLDSNGQASITPSDVDAGSFDNFGVSGLGVLPNSFSCADLGLNTVRLGVIDPSFNTSECEAVVTVVDPLGSCSGNGNGNGGNGGGSMAVGGELIPLETTMILLAGTQNTAAWMIPVIVSVIGFTIVILRKF